jgi:hypothetical protein
VTEGTNDEAVAAQNNGTKSEREPQPVHDRQWRQRLRHCQSISATILLGLETVLFVVVAASYRLLIRSRRDASTTASIPAQSRVTYFLTTP